MIADVGTGLPGRSAMVDNESGLLAGVADVAAAIRRTEEEHAAALPLLPREACAALLSEARDFTWRRARPIVGEGERRVYQDFELTTDFPHRGAYRELARAVERLIQAALRAIEPPPLAWDFRVNDLILQRYPAGCAGITPHRDHVRYVGLVAIVVLAGTARFFVCDDRAGSNAREIATPPGHMTVLRAPGLFGRRDRPFHLLREITAERWSFGLRHDVGATRPEG